MANSKQIVYLSQTQYAELIANGTITVNGVTVTYDENDIYVTPQAESVTDVRVAGTSVAANGVAEIPVVHYNTPGVVRIGATNGWYGIYSNNDGVIMVQKPNASELKNGFNPYKPIVPETQHASTFYGLAKASGDATQSQSDNEVGTYTPEAKGAIQKMLGVSDLIATEENDLTASKAYAIGDIFTSNGKLYKATAAIAQDAAIILPDGVGANCEEVTVADGFVKFTDYASSNTAGVVKTGTYIQIGNDGVISPVPASTSNIKSGVNFLTLVPARQHAAVFYGLAKAAGDATQSASDNEVGTYTPEAKTAIQNMLDVPNKAAVTTIETKVDSFVDNAVIVSPTQPTAEDNKIWVNEDASYVEVPTMAEFNALDASAVKDVQVDGTSIVSNGIASLSKANATTYGLVKTQSGNTGVYTANDGTLYLATATDSQLKSGSGTYPRAITPGVQNKAVFYGLAQAAGDTTMASSSNAVGTYTDNAKASIKAMLGIQDGSTGTVDVSGTTPTITAVENTRYICGEVTSLSFTPPASGIAIVRFTSGTSVTVLTIPSTVKFPEWFDPTSLETDTIYEICVTDGVYGAVMTWPL